MFRHSSLLVRTVRYIRVCCRSWITLVLAPQVVKAEAVAGHSGAEAAAAAAAEEQRRQRVLQDCLREYKELNGVHAGRIQQLEEESAASSTELAQLQAFLCAAEEEIAAAATAATAATAAAAAAAAGVTTASSVSAEENELAINALQDERGELRQRVADLQEHFEYQVSNLWLPLRYF